MENIFRKLHFIFKRFQANFIPQVHTNSTPFKCDLCEYSAKTKTIIKMHRTLHFRDRKRGIHAETDVQCDQVNGYYLALFSLMLHEG